MDNRRLLVIGISVFLMLAGAGLLVYLYLSATQVERCTVLIEKVAQDDKLNAFQFCVDSFR